MFEKNMKFPLLLDAYASLLTERKREILDYYYNEDYSLSEISELTGISRQGVRDSIKKSEDELYSIEEKLGLVRLGDRIGSAVDSLRRLSEAETDSQKKAELEKIISLLTGDGGAQKN